MKKNTLIKQKYRKTEIYAFKRKGKKNKSEGQTD